MSATSHQDDAYRAEGRRRIDDLVKTLNALGLLILALSERFALVAKAHAEYVVKNQTILKPKPRDLTWNVIYIGGVVVLYILDIAVFGPTAAHIVRMGLPFVPILTDVLAALARIGVPLPILGFEILLASAIHHYGDRVSGHVNRFAQVVFAAFGIAVAAAVTGLVLAQDLARRAATVGAEEGLSIGQMAFYATAVLVLILHVTLLFLGEKGAAAKDFVVAKWTERKLRKAMEKARAPLATAHADFVDQGTTYLQAVEAHTSTFGERLPFGPFCEAALQLFAEHFPYVRLPRPAAPRMSPSKSRSGASDDEFLAEVIDIPSGSHRGAGSGTPG